MALSMRTALEIFTNPRDLQVWIEKEGGKWGFSIARGPHGKYRILVDSNGFTKNKRKVVKVLGDTLKEVSKICVKDFGNSSSPASQYLNAKLIGQIVQGLRQCNVVKTYKLE